MPATADERRYFVLDVADCKRGDRDYFTKLYQAIGGDELAAFFDYLLRLDLSEFDFRNPPHTTALNRQKLAGADSLTRFWLDCLTNGEIVGADVAGLTVARDTDAWPEDIVAQVLHGAYVAHAHDHGDRRPLADQHMAQRLAKLMPVETLRRDRGRSKPYGEIVRPTRYLIPHLDACRAAVLEAMQISAYTWPEG